MNWTQYITPRGDIIKEKINESSFAARLDEVASGRAAPYYRDPVLFFDNTHVTKGMQDLLHVASATFLTGNCPGNNVVELQTSFGGGKTHCLVALYHLSQRPDLLVTHPNLKDLKLGTPEASLSVNTCVLVGMDYNVSKPRAATIDGKSTTINTWWGEIAYQLGGERAFKVVAANDAEWTPPSKSTLHEMFQTLSGSSLILLDEIVHYLINLHKKDPDLYGVTINFFQAFVEEVSNHPEVLLVFTLATADLELVNEVGRRAFHTISIHTKRHKTTLEPIQYQEFYYIIRRRLFEPLSQSQVDDITRVTAKFLDYYKAQGKFFPPELLKGDPTGQSLGYEEKLKLGFPFHPSLIDVLYQKWGPHPDFQRARGMLRVFAKILQATVAHPAGEMIMTGDVPLLDPGVKNELLEYLGSNFEPVITTDHERATQLENAKEDDYKAYHLGQALFTTIFFHSIRHAQGVHGASREDLCLGVLTPAVKYPALVIDLLEDMKNHLFHLFETGDRYLLSTRANVIAMIIAEKEALSQDQVRLEAFIESLMGRAIPKSHKVIVWPDSSRDLPDEDRITFVAMDPQFLVSKASTVFPARIRDEIIPWVENRGSLARERKNSLVFAFFDETEYVGVRDKALELMAVENITSQARQSGSLEPEQITDLETRKNTLEKAIPSAIVLAYRYLGRPITVQVTEKEGGVALDLALYAIENRKTQFVTHVREEMIARDWLVEQIGRKLLPTAIDQPKNTQELWLRQFSIPSLELLADEQVFKAGVRTIVETVKPDQPNFGYGTLPKNNAFSLDLAPGDFSKWVIPGEKISERQVEISSQAYLLPEGVVQAILANQRPPEPPEPTPPPEKPPIEKPPVVKPQPPEPPPPAPVSSPQSLSITLTVPWNRVNDLRKFAPLCAVLGQADPDTKGSFTWNFSTETAFPKMTVKNLKQSIEALRAEFGDLLEIDLSEPDN